MFVDPNQSSFYYGVHSQADLIRAHKQRLNIEDVRINRTLSDLEEMKIPSQEQIDDLVYEHYKASLVDPTIRQRHYQHTNILESYETQLKEMIQMRKEAR